MNNMSENNECILVKAIPLHFLENDYIGRVYLLCSPLKLVFTLDFTGSKTTTPMDHEYEFFSADPEINSTFDILNDIVDELCSGFLCDTEKQEQKIQEQAEELALEIVEQLNLLIEYP